MTISYYETKETQMRFESQYEELARSSARRTLQVLKGELLDSIKAGEVDPYSNESLQSWARRYLDPIRNLTETSDGFMIEMGSEEFIWDGSPDCAKGGIKRTMRDEVVDQIKAQNYYKLKGYQLPISGVIRASDLDLLPPTAIEDMKRSRIILHYDYKLADATFDKMRENYDTRQGDNLYWNFDGSKEYLEWVVVPQPRVGFGGENTTEFGTRNPSYRGILIVLGTQEDELGSMMKGVSSRFYSIRACIGLATALVLIICILMIRVIGKSCPLTRHELINKPTEVQENEQ
jgi:hypothetical protein